MGIFGSVGKAISSLFGGDSRPASTTKPNGGDGVQAYAGFLSSPERDPRLNGSRKWIEYGNATNTSVIATGLRYSLGLLGGTEWHAEPNPRGGKDAQRAVDIVTQGLLQAQMTRPWPAIIRKQALYKYYGFALHEWTVKRRDDGMVVFADIAHRPQYTIDRWDKPSEQESWLAVGQLTRNGNRFVIPRGRLFYAVDDTLTDSPDGVGLLRHVIELVRRLGVLEGLEGHAYETDLRGMPIGRAPIKDLLAQAAADGANSKAKMEAYVSDRVANLHGVLTSYAKTPEKLQYLLLDSSTYTNADGNTVSPVHKWAFDLARGGATGVAEVAAAIGRVQLEIARVLGIEFALMGGDSSGSLAQHADKTSMFGVSLQTTLSELAAFATRDLARPLVGLNGLDPDTCTPTLVAEPISTDAIEVTARALQLIGASGMMPDDPALPVLRKRMRLPPPPKPTPAQMGMLGARQRPEPRILGAPPKGAEPALDDPGAQPKRPAA